MGKKIVGTLKTITSKENIEMLHVIWHEILQMKKQYCLSSKSCNDCPMLHGLLQECRLKNIMDEIDTVCYIVNKTENEELT